MSSHFWGLTTAPDDTGVRTDYADRTIGALELQGLHVHSVGLEVYACDDACKKAGGWLRVFIDTRRMGQCWNFLRALRAGVESGAERITLLEDDIEITRGFVARVEATEVPDDCAFISWFDPFLGCPRLGTYYDAHPEIGPKEKIPDAPGFVRRVAALFYCNQALTFRRAAAEMILESSLTRMWSVPNEGDQLIAQVMRHDFYAVHVPSIVQHVGMVSLCNPGTALEKNRVSHHYRGADFDAGTLEVFT